MTRDAFAQLAAQGVILLDGATGSNLMTAGKPRGVCTEQWVLDHPTEAAALAEEYLDMNAAVVEAAIPNMGLTFKSAQDAKEELDTFYNLLYNFEPSMIGGELPDEGLFYAG